VVLPFHEILGLEDVSALKASSGFFGGIALLGETCGALLGGAMVLALKYGRSDPEEGMNGLNNIIPPLRKLVRNFTNEFGTIRCYEITKVNLSDEKELNEFIKPGGGYEKCAKLCSTVAGMVADILSEKK
jgi:C_GCAxxG_C_C family probable redox protein